MSRRDPGAATGTAAVEPGRCACTHLMPFHKPGANGRGACSASTCDCRRYEEGRVLGLVHDTCTEEAS